MIGYGLSKAAVHQLTASLAQEKGGLPKDAHVSCILPITLDTPMNRKFMANAGEIMFILCLMMRPHLTAGATPSAYIQTKISPSSAIYHYSLIPPWCLLRLLAKFPVFCEWETVGSNKLLVGLFLRVSHNIVLINLYNISKWSITCKNIPILYWRKIEYLLSLFYKFLFLPDFSTWTKMSYVAEMFSKWTEDPSSRHPNGSLVKIITKDDKTEEVLAWVRVLKTVQIKP